MGWQPALMGAGRRDLQGAEGWRRQRQGWGPRGRSGASRCVVGGSHRRSLREDGGREGCGLCGFVYVKFKNWENKAEMVSPE